MVDGRAHALLAMQSIPDMRIASLFGKEVVVGKRPEMPAAFDAKEEPFWNRMPYFSGHSLGCLGVNW